MEPQAEIVEGPEAPPLEEKKAKPFQVQYKNIALTYSQCNVAGDVFKDAFKALPFVINHGIFFLKMVQEPHADDLGLHYHVALKVIKKPNLKNCRGFDITIGDQVYHPNIMRMKTDWWATIYMGIAKVLWEHSEGASTVNLDIVEFGRKRKIYEDMRWYRNHLIFQKLKMPVWPLEIPYRAIDGRDCKITIPKPDPANKKRHYWVYGPPDVGKSLHLMHAFREYRVLFPNSKYPFEAYDGQDLVVFDDVFPHYRDLLNCSNTYECSGVPVGDSRYCSVFWQQDHCRVMFVLLNVDIDTHFSKAEQRTLDAIHARFNEVNLN